jgi:hypothetical protein
MSGVTIVFCGLVRNPNVLKLALIPALSLRNLGKVQRVILSTWCGEVDRMPGGLGFFQDLGVEVVETAFPKLLEVDGNIFQQMLAMDRALDMIDEDDLVLRTRTDIVISQTTALEAILAQDLSLGPRVVNEEEGEIFSQRVWVPYFHPAYPFLMADQMFFGRARDLRKLNNFELLTEAYQITSRVHEVFPSHNSGAGAEIRRYLTPFAHRFSLLREYQFIWPKHCIGTSLLCDVMAFNFRSAIYREYMALSFAMTNRYFRVGGLPAASGQVLVVGGGQDEQLVVRMSLVNDDPVSPLLADRLAIPRAGSKLFNPSYGSAWLESVFADPASDPNADDWVFQPLARVAAFKGDSLRREAFGRYRDELWALADCP